jgi:hypothetical protein
LDTVDKLFDRHGNNAGRERDDCGARISFSLDVGLLFSPCELSRIFTFERLLTRQDRIDNASANEAGRSRLDDRDSSVEGLHSLNLFRAYINGQAHVDEGEQIEVGQAVQQHPARVVVGAPEHHVAALQNAVSARIRYDAKLGGISRITFQMSVASLPHDQALNSIRLIGKQVISLVEEQQRRK